MFASPSISVVVPFLNNERHIGACIDSLIDQKGVHGTYELVFVDNGSTDNSASIVDQYDAVELLREDSKGAYAARNTGIRQARGALIAFTDADCSVDSDWLRAIQAAMSDPRIGILVGHVRYPPQASLALRMLGAYENAKTEYVLERCEPAQHFAYTNNMAIRSSLFEELGPFEEWDRAADTELVHRLAALRPDLRFAYRPSMKITHLEFQSARERARRLWLYEHTNSRIDSFRGLGLLERLAVLKYLFRRHESSESAREATD